MSRAHNSLASQRLPALLAALSASLLAAMLYVLLGGGSDDDKAHALRSATGPPKPLFSPTSVWNRPLPANAAIDPNSFTLMTAFRAEIARERRAGIGPWIQTHEYSTPLYIVGKRRRTRRVRLDRSTHWNASLRRAFRRVPIGNNMKPAAGTDGHLTIWQPSKDRLWEFWRARKTSRGWQASWGGAMQRVSKNPGWYSPSVWRGAQWGWGATATSLPVIAGVIRVRELEYGRIDHALAMAIPNARAGVFAWPAQRTDGTGPPALLPEGARLRLNPRVDIRALNLPPVTRMLAEAAQRYGIIVRDRTKNAIGFFAEDVKVKGRNPYGGPNGLFDGQDPGAVLERFPWQHLQVLRMSLCNRAPCFRRGAP